MKESVVKTIIFPFADLVTIAIIIAFKALLNLSHTTFESIDSKGVFSTTINFSSLEPKDFAGFDGGMVGGGMVGFFGRGGGCVVSRGGGVIGNGVIGGGVIGGGVIGGGGGGVGRGGVGKGNVVARGGVRI